MRPSFSTRVGKLLQDLREQAGMRQDELAIHLNVSMSTIQDWEEGRSEPPDDLEFYYRLRKVPGFTQIHEVKEIKIEGYQGILVSAGFRGESGAILEQRIHELEEARDKDPLSFTKPLSFTDMGHHDIMSAPKPSLLTDLTSILVQSEAKPLRIHYTHAMPEHAPDLVDEGKWQLSNKPEQRSPIPLPGSGVIYDRGRLTTLTEASRVTGVKLGTLHNYMSDGKLTERGRIKGNGGGKVLIDLDELDSVLSNRKSGGRPRKIPQRLVNKRPRGRPRKS
jgi:transcriptional regulator with XRE-family HTH domain